MSNITAYPLQDWFETTLAQSWNGAIGTVYLNTAPSFTFPSGVKTYIVVNPWKTNMQVGEIDSLHVWNKTVNVSSISVGSWAGTTYTQESHSVWSTVIISDNYQFWKNIVDAVNSKMDLSGGTFTGDVSFSWTGTEFRLPNLTTAERLALTPWNGTIVYDSTLWENYQYIAWAWNAFAAWSTQPNASETVAGKVEEATQTQLNNGDATGETGARLFTNPSKLPTAVASYVTNNAGVNAAVKAEALEVIDDEWVESIVDRDTYFLWEDADAGDSVFVEDMVTFASATSVQAIGDVTANTRVAILAFGSWVASNTLKLSLRKYVSPWVNLSVEIETYAAWEPSGTLFDPDATSTVLESGLTTSLVDTTVTLADTITIPKWQPVFIVLKAVGDVVNGTNYFGVGYKLQDTTTRRYMKYDGADWALVANNSETNTHWVTLDTTQSTTVKRGFRFEITRPWTITTATKNASATATTGYIVDTLLNVIATASFSGNNITFNKKLDIGTYFLLADAGGASYNSRINGSSTSFPKSGTYCNITGGTNDWWPTISTTYLRTFASISFDAILANNYVYVDSDLFTEKVLSLTDSTYKYKLPTDLPRVLTESKTAGENAIATTLGLNDNFSGLTALVDYYISQTPGAISSTAGVYNYYIGSAIDATTLNVGKKQVGVFITILTSTSNSADTGTIQAPTDWFVTVKLSASNGGSAIATNTLTYWPSSASDTVGEIGVADASIEKATMTFPVKKGYYWRALTAGTNTTTTTNVFFTPYV